MFDLVYRQILLNIPIALSLTIFFVLTFNPLKNVLRKIKKSSKVRLGGRPSVSVHAYFMDASANDSLLKCGRGLNYVPMLFWDFPSISFFDKMPCDSLSH